MRTLLQTLKNVSKIFFFTTLMSLTLITNPLNAQECDFKINSNLNESILNITKDYKMVMTNDKALDLISSFDALEKQYDDWMIPFWKALVYSGVATKESIDKAQNQMDVVSKKTTSNPSNCVTAALFGLQSHIYEQEAMLTMRQGKLSFFMPNQPTSPVIKDSLVYFGSWKATFGEFDKGTGHLYAVNIMSKQEIWRFKAKYGTGSTPIISDGMLFFGNGEMVSFGGKPIGKKGCFYALDSKSGQQIWQFDTEGGINVEPSIKDGIVYFGCHDNFLYALDAKTGREKWKFKTGGPILSKPIIENDIIYLGSDDGYLYAIDINTRAEKWRFQVEPDNKSDFIGGVSTPAVAENIIFVTRHTGLLFAIDMVTKEKLWTYPSDTSNLPTDGFGHTPPFFIENSIYIGAHDNYLHSLEAETGKLRWKKTLDEGRAQGTIPLVEDSSVYQVDLNGIYLYSINMNNQKTQWKYETKGSIFCIPSVSSNLVFINSTSGHLYAIDTRTGKLDFEFVPKN